jgi:hypothetical protein
MNSHTINHTEDILEDIKSNTATLSNINLNTDGLETKLDTVITNISSLDAKITKGENDISSGTGCQQVLIMGKDQSGNLDTINVDNNGHLKITLNDIESGITSSIKVSNDDITKGENDISAGTGCQQVLIMGKDAFSPFNLEPLRTSSNKLLVENSELVNLPPITSNGTTIKTNIGMLGTNDGTNYRTMKVNDDGVLSTNDIKNSVQDVSWMTTESISSNTRSTSTLDTQGFSCVMIYGEATSGTPSNNVLKIQGSNSSSGTYYHVGGLSLATYDGLRYLLKEDAPLTQGNHPRYLKIYNSDTSSVSLTLRAVLSNKNEY